MERIRKRHFAWHWFGNKSERADLYHLGHVAPCLWVHQTFGQLWCLRLPDELLERKAPGWCVCHQSQRLWGRKRNRVCICTEEGKGWEWRNYHSRWYVKSEVFWWNSDSERTDWICVFCRGIVSHQCFVGTIRNAGIWTGWNAGRRIRRWWTAKGSTKR